MADLEKTAVTTADASPIDAEKGAEIMEKYEKVKKWAVHTVKWDIISFPTLLCRMTANIR